MINGKSLKNLNIRSTPVVKTGNIVSSIAAGSSFIGSSLVVDEAVPSQKWIKLVSIDGVAVSGNQYLASWLVTFTETPSVPQEPLGVPVEIRMTEIFADGDTRESVWNNPQIVG